MFGYVSQFHVWHPFFKKNCDEKIDNSQQQEIQEIVIQMKRTIANCTKG